MLDMSMWGAVLTHGLRLKSLYHCVRGYLDNLANYDLYQPIGPELTRARLSEQCVNCRRHRGAGISHNEDRGIHRVRLRQAMEAQMAPYTPRYTAIPIPISTIAVMVLPFFSSHSPLIW
jgi:hypothetical protein